MPTDDEASRPYSRRPPSKDGQFAQPWQNRAVGRILEQARARLDISQPELARRLSERLEGVSVGKDDVYRWEKGRSPVQGAALFDAVLQSGASFDALAVAAEDIHPDVVEWRAGLPDVAALEHEMRTMKSRQASFERQLARLRSRLEHDHGSPRQVQPDADVE